VPHCRLTLSTISTFLASSSLHRPLSHCSPTVFSHQPPHHPLPTVLSDHPLQPSSPTVLSPTVVVLSHCRSSHCPPTVFSSPPSPHRPLPTVFSYCPLLLSSPTVLSYCPPLLSSPTVLSRRSFARLFSRTAVPHIVLLPSSVSNSPLVSSSRIVVPHVVIMCQVPLHLSLHWQEVHPIHLYSDFKIVASRFHCVISTAGPTARSMLFLAALTPVNGYI
jgi:hypothetical protein